MKPTINSSKHYTHHTLETIAAAAISTEEIIESVSVKDVNLGREVRDGAIVKAVYIERWVRSQETSPGSFVAILVKLPGGNAAVTAVDLANLHAYDNKKNILYTTQGLSNDGASNAMPIMRGWFKIPKGKQRMGLGDKLVLVVLAQALALNTCGFTTYKEYF